MRPRHAAPTLTLALAAAGAFPPTRALGAQAPGPDARAERVARGLLPAVVVRGRPETTYTLAERMRRYGVPGVSVAVIDGGRVVWARAWGVVEAGRPAPVDTATLFQAGSISKAAASVMALRLGERGVVRLDDDVNRTLVSWKVPESEHTRVERVTLRRLLSHSAGLNVPSFAGYPPGAPLPTVPQVLDGAPPANTPPVRVVATPGGGWRYSGGGTMVVQQLLVDVAGEPFEALARRELFAPAGMAHSSFEQALPPALAARAATGHSPADAPLAGRWRVHPELAAAGMWSTAPDLARLALAVQASLAVDSADAAARLLRPSTAREMLTRHAGRWGLGFALEGEGAAATFGHDGSTAGFTCRLVAFREGGRGVAVMTNGESEALIDEIVRGVAREHGWPAAPRPEKAVAAVDASAYRALVGRYRIELGARRIDVAVTAAGGRLYFTGSSGRPAEILPESPLRYFSRDSGTEFTFVRDARGAPATALVIDQGGQRFTARRARVTVPPSTPPRARTAGRPG